MREAAILHAAAVEVLLIVGLHGHRSHALFNGSGGGLLEYYTLALTVGHGHEASNLVHYHLDARRGHHRLGSALLDLKTGHVASGIKHENLCGRISHGVAHLSSLGVLEDANDVVAIEVKHAAHAIGHSDLHGRAIHFLTTHAITLSKGEEHH